MANWLKISRPNIEMSNGFLQYQAGVINLDAASAFAMQNPGSITIFIDGKAYVIQQQFDEKAYKVALRYIEQRTQGQTLP